MYGVHDLADEEEHYAELYRVPLMPYRLGMKPVFNLVLGLGSEEEFPERYAEASPTLILQDRILRLRMGAKAEDKKMSIDDNLQEKIPPLMVR